MRNGGWGTPMTVVPPFFLPLDSSLSPELYVYNWAAAWPEDSEGGAGHHVFPDGKPFPRPHGWRKWNFVYVFHTLGSTFILFYLYLFGWGWGGRRARN